MYYISFNDNTNEFEVVNGKELSGSWGVFLGVVFKSKKSAKKYLTLLQSLFMTSYASDKKMFVRVFNRLIVDI